MSRLRKQWASLMCVGLVMSAGVLFAQNEGGRGRGRGGFGGFGAPSPISLAGNEAVQKELGLNEDQISKVSKINEELRAELQKQVPDRSSFQGLSAEERRKKFAELGESRRATETKFMPQLEAALQPEQLTRLKQISLQVESTAAFEKPEVVKALELTDEQQAKLKTLNDEYREKQRASFREAAANAGGDQNARREASRKAREEHDAKLMEVLTAAQKTKLEELRGKPFDLSQLRGGRRQRQQNN